MSEAPSTNNLINENIIKSSLITTEIANSTDSNIKSTATNTKLNNDAANEGRKQTNLRYLEIWRGVIHNNQIKYCLSTSSLYELKENLGLFSLSDIDRDGALDIIFPVLESPPKILVAFNKQKITYDWTEDYCATHIKQSGKEIPLLFDDFVVNKNTPTMQTYPLSESNQDSFYSDSLVKPLVRFADINSDSYPDFIVTLSNKENFSRTVKIFYNFELKFNSKSTGLRTFSMNNTYVSDLVNNAVYASFFDIAEDGKIDVVIVYKENENLFNTIGLFNTYIYDCYYLKSLILKQRKVNYAFCIGVSLRYVCADVDGTRRMDLSTQGVQLNQISLNLPYAYIGVGRSNNYIENFHVINGNNVNVNLNCDKNY